MQIINKPIKELIPYDKNPRKNDEAVKYVKASIEQFGFKVPIVIDAQGVIVAGHTRLKAAKELGMKEVPCIVADDLNEEQIRAFRLVDNKTGEAAEWDIELLNTELLDLEANFDMSDFGFEIYPPTGEVSDDDFDADAVADAIAEPVTKLGDIWQLGRHRLMCGDSTDRATVDRLMDGQKADMVFTDPPYGMRLDADYSKMPQTTVHGKKYDNVIGDNVDFDFSAFADIPCKEQFWWGADYYCQMLPKGGSWFVWDKRNENNDTALGSGFELCWSKTPHKRRVLRYLWSGFTARDPGEKRVHPTQKPIAMCEEMLNEYAGVEDVVYDPFGGSGTTMMAAEHINRACYMMELDPKYCDVIIKRWETLTGQKAVLNGEV